MRPYFRFIQALPLCFALSAGINLRAQETTSDAPPPVRISGGVAQSLLLDHTPPTYPQAPKQAGVQGAVVLRAIIDSTGHVQTLNVVSGPEALRDAATDAVSTWLYKPYLLNGQPTPVDTTVTINFTLQNPPAPTEAADPGSPATTAQQGTTPQATPMAQSGPQPLNPNTFCGSSQPGAPDYHARVSSAVMQGLILKKNSPYYPDARGAVVLVACIAANGAVEKALPVSGPEVMRSTAIKSLMKWRYKPFLLNGVGVPVNTSVTVPFE